MSAAVELEVAAEEAVEAVAAIGNANGDASSAGGEAGSMPSALWLMGSDDAADDALIVE